MPRADTPLAPPTVTFWGATRTVTGSMHQLTAGEKRFPSSTEHRDVASDYLALRKHNTGSRWIFTEAQNPLNPNSHCDIAWAGGLASHAQSNFRDVGAAVVYDHWDSARLWKPMLRR